MRIGVTTNAFWAPTGYGQQANEFLPKLKGAGHEVALMANYGLAGTTLEFNGIPVMGQGMDAYSNDLTPAQIAWWIAQNPDQVGLGITLYDVWVYKSPQWDTIPIASWVPVDHSVVPVEVAEWFKRGTDAGKWAIAMSKFGEHELLTAGVPRERLFYAPHSINTQVFKPTESTIREEMGIPADAHLTMINSANKGVTPVRKCWAEMLLAWSQFAQKHNDAWLYIHTETFGLASGVRIERLLQAVKAPMDRVRVVPQFEYRQGLPAQVLAKSYSASDCLLMTSRGEGFGIPVIESLACSTPVIVTNWTAQPELCGVGWKVNGQPEWDEMQTGWWMVPNVGEITDALEQSYALKADTEKMANARTEAVQFAQAYDTDKVFTEHWQPILATLEDELKAKRKPPANRQQRRTKNRK
jgi:glycosyltransferase involved in cell wall biosynthesis